jgi:polyphenol oxidase
MRVVRSTALAAFPHGFTTREGGASPAPWASLNLGRSVGDDPARVAENWRRLEAGTGLRFARVAQVHGARVVHLRAATGPGGPADEADGVLSTTPGLAACVAVADCVPVLLADPESGTVAAVHAGWRGTLARAVAAGVQAIARLSGAPPRRLRAAVGPSIGPCCYQVSPDLADRFAAELGPVVRAADDGPHLDLWESNRRILLEAGLEERWVEVLGRCTSCDAVSWFSHRRDRGRTGRQVAFIAPPAADAEEGLP